MLTKVHFILQSFYRPFFLISPTLIGISLYFRQISFIFHGILRGFLPYLGVNQSVLWLTLTSDGFSGSISITIVQNIADLSRKIDGNRKEEAGWIIVMQNTVAFMPGF